MVRLTDLHSAAIAVPGSSACEKCQVFMLCVSVRCMLGFHRFSIVRPAAYSFSNIPSPTTAPKEGEIAGLKRRAPDVWHLVRCRLAVLRTTLRLGAVSREPWQRLHSLASEGGCQPLSLASADEVQAGVPSVDQVRLLERLFAGVQTPADLSSSVSQLALAAMRLLAAVVLRAGCERQRAGCRVAQRAAPPPPQQRRLRRAEDGEGQVEAVRAVRLRRHRTVMSQARTLLHPTAAPDRSDGIRSRFGRVV